MLALLAVVGVMPAAVRAQEVRGTVTDRATGAALAGVVVQLSDDRGSVAARALTDASGAYRLQARDPGRYSVRALRIGYRPGAPVQVILAQSQVAQLALTSGPPIALDTVRVASRRACELRPDSAGMTFAVWEQVRTAFTAALLTSQQQLVTSAVAFERALDARGTQVLRQSTSVRGGVAGTPWRSIPADSLSRVGYAITSPGGVTTWFAPDLAVLTSTSFAAEHCLRLVGDGARLGVAFEPIRDRRRLPGIAGTIWLGRATSELQSLEYRYVNVGRTVESVAGGALDFARLATGEWLITRWQLRVPVVETRMGAGGVLVSGGQVEGRAIRTVREEGGMLTLVRSGRDTLWRATPVVLSGQVRDDLGAAVPNARVTLRGTGLATTTDAAGRFDLDAVVPGQYTVDVETPLLAAVGDRPSQVVTLVQSVADMTLRVPTDAGVAARACGPTEGLLAGRVVTASGAPAAQATAFVEWTAFSINAAEIIQRRREVASPSDVHGYFRACGVRSRHPLVVRAEGPQGTSRVDTLVIPRDSGVAFVTLRLDRPPVSAMTITGRVIEDVNGAPIPEVEVVMPALGRSTMTSESGEYRFHDLPRGTHEVRVRRIGYQQAGAVVVVDGTRVARKSFVLSRVQTLDTVSVVADPRLAEFERNRAMGLGRFLDRAEIEKQAHKDLSALIEHLPGILVRRAGTAAYVASRRAMGTSIELEQQFCNALRFEARAPRPPCACYTQVYVDNVPMYAGFKGEQAPDINSIHTTQIEAIEFYAGAAQTPARYSRLNSHCGVLVIHTRRSGGARAAPYRSP